MFHMLVQMSLVSHQEVWALYLRENMFAALYRYCMMGTRLTFCEICVKVDNLDLEVDNLTLFYRKHVVSPDCCLVSYM